MSQFNPKSLMKKWVNIICALSSLVLLYFVFHNHTWASVLLFIVLLVYLLFNIYGVTYLSSNYFFPALTSQPNGTGKNAVLTFDDGPHGQTKEILAVLEKHNALATFFMIGKNCVENENVVSAVFAKGHIIGNHSYNHSTGFPVLGCRKIQREIENTNNTIKRIVGKTPLLFRPPFGLMSPIIACALRRMNMKMIGWDLRTFDTRNDNKKTLKRFQKKMQGKQNVICLLHDDTENITELLDSIIIYLKENNFKIIALSEALNVKPYAEI